MEKISNYIRLLFIFMLIVITIIACDKKKDNKADVENVSLKRKQHEETVRLGIMKAFGPSTLNFQSDNIIFSYQIQSWFEENSKHNIMFKGFVRDVIKNTNGIVAEFGYPIGGIMSRKIINFKLHTDYNTIKSVLESPPKTFYNLTKRISPDYYVVCKVRDVSRSKIYFSGDRRKDEEALESEESELIDTIMVTGELIAVVKLYK